MQQVISKMPFASVSKQVLVQNFSYENDFDVHENERAGKSTKSRFCTKAKAGNSECTVLTIYLFDNVLLDTITTRR